MESSSSAVFVVDDERLIADTTAMILRINGYEAIAFYDAESALKQLDSNKPDIVISDVIMPGMNGVDLAVLIDAARIVESCFSQGRRRRMIYLRKLVAKAICSRFCKSQSFLLSC